MERIHYSPRWQRKVNVQYCLIKGLNDAEREYLVAEGCENYCGEDLVIWLAIVKAPIYCQLLFYKAYGDRRLSNNHSIRHNFTTWYPSIQRFRIDRVQGKNCQQNPRNAMLVYFNTQYRWNYRFRWRCSVSTVSQSPNLLWLTLWVHPELAGVLRSTGRPLPPVLPIV